MLSWWRRYLLVLLRTHADEGDGTVRESEGRGEGGQVPQIVSGSKTQQVEEDKEGNVCPTAEWLH